MRVPGASADHTFLFVDLVGFTALADIEGDDRAAEVALELHRRVRATLHEYGGEEVKALGDGIMLRCADAGEGIRLGLRIVGELEDDPRIPSVRVGIHSGPAVGHEGDWYGRAVNVAARLCAVAPGGEVLVSDTAREAAGRLRKVEFGERRLHWLRNVTEPVPTFTARERDCPGSGRWRAIATRARRTGLAKASFGVAS
ncbi:MAG TPA: adenylate/guanylate cyclase domain-containing protein [Solirubrobacterales bacterium]